MWVERHRAADIDLYRSGAPSRTVQLVIDCFWIAFFIVACHGASRLRHLGIERLAWLAADFVALTFILLRPDAVIRLLRQNLILVSWPLLACASAFWSLTPAYSFYHGVQLFLTVLVGLCLTLTASLRHILVLLFVAITVTAMLSLAMVAISPWTAIDRSGEWLGVYTHKNVLGNMMGVMAITGVALFLSGWRPLVSGGGVVLALGLLALSRSGTAIVALAAVLALVPLLFTVTRGTLFVALAAGLALMAIAAAFGIFAMLDINPYTYGLEALGKDETLTGRTILWEFAVDAFQERPWLGYGYKGWWESAETDAGLLRFVVQQDLWFFHNTFLDLAVAFGIWGPIFLVMGLGVGVYRTVAAYAARRDPLLLWPIQYVALSIIYCSVDFVLFTNHSFGQMLFVIAVTAQMSSSQRETFEHSGPQFAQQQR